MCQINYDDGYVGDRSIPRTLVIIKHSNEPNIVSVEGRDWFSICNKDYRHHSQKDPRCNQDH